MVVAGFVVGGASGSGELAWVAGAGVTGAEVTGVEADAGWVDAACVDDGDEPQPDKLPARMAAATTANAIGDFLMAHPLVCRPVMSRSKGLSCCAPAGQQRNRPILSRMA